jgi:hypothetical protein
MSHYVEELTESAMDGLPDGDVGSFWKFYLDA